MASPSPILVECSPECTLLPLRVGFPSPAFPLRPLTRAGGGGVGWVGFPKGRAGSKHTTPRPIGLRGEHPLVPRPISVPREVQQRQSAMTGNKRAKTREGGMNATKVTAPRQEKITAYIDLRGGRAMQGEEGWHAQRIRANPPHTQLSQHHPQPNSYQPHSNPSYSSTNLACPTTTLQHTILTSSQPNSPPSHPNPTMAQPTPIPTPPCPTHNTDQPNTVNPAPLQPNINSTHSDLIPFHTTPTSTLLIQSPPHFNFTAHQPIPSLHYPNTCPTQSTISPTQPAQPYPRPTLTQPDSITSHPHPTQSHINPITFHSIPSQPVSNPDHTQSTPLQPQPNPSHPQPNLQPVRAAPQTGSEEHRRDGHQAGLTPIYKPNREGPHATSDASDDDLGMEATEKVRDSRSERAATGHTATDHNKRRRNTDEIEQWNGQDRTRRRHEKEATRHMADRHTMVRVDGSEPHAMWPPTQQGQLT